MLTGRKADVPGLPRRQFLEVGVLGTMLNLPQLLQTGSVSGAATARRGSEKSCIFIVQQGGASHIDTLDLKPAAPAEYRGPYKPIATPVPGLQICELLPRLAQLAPRYCLIRSMTHAAAGHGDGMHVCLSGQSKPPLDAPYFGSIVSKVRPGRARVPSYVWVQEMESDAGNHYFTGGFLGPNHAPLRVGKGNDNFASPGFRVTAFDPPRGMTTEQLGERHQLLTTLDRASSAAPGERFRRNQERAFELVTGPQARRAFDVAAEPARLRERYGRHPLGQNLIVARRLIEAGVRLVSVHAFTGFEPQTKWPPVVNVWDMHGAQNRMDVSIFAKNTYGLPWVLPRFDEAVSALLEDLHQRGLLENTLVVAVGEFGRTPRINANVGRDHYPACYSALVAGAGIRGGAIYGASDKVAAFPKDCPVTPEDFGATLLHALDVPPTTRLSPDGFTRPASTGRPILELFG
jgi:uncharacterized protein (DUF1501 family)